MLLVMTVANDDKTISTAKMTNMMFCESIE